MWSQDEELVEINADLRKAANYLCIAFSVGSQTLFLGDLDASALAEVVAELEKEHRVNFRRIVAAHHGTSWHRDLLHLRCRDLVVSVGKNLWRHINPAIGRIAKNVHTTRLQGSRWYR